MTKPKTTQDDPTQPRPVDPKTGRQLDEFGLPISGPARVARLAELRKPDPREDPAAWGVKTPADAGEPDQVEKE